MVIFTDIEINFIFTCFSYSYMYLKNFSVSETNLFTIRAIVYALPVP